jgi:hypothetical protein
MIGFSVLEFLPTWARGHAFNTAFTLTGHLHFIYFVCSFKANCSAFATLSISRAET